MPNVPLTLIFGASEDKDVEGMFLELVPNVKNIVITESDPGRDERFTFGTNIETTGHRLKL